MAEQDWVGHLHHGGLQMQRDQHSIALGRIHLASIELAQCTSAEEGGADELGVLDLHAILEHSDFSTRIHMLDAQGTGFGNRGGLLVAVEIAAHHVRHAGL